MMADTNIRRTPIFSTNLHEMHPPFAAVYVKTFTHDILHEILLTGLTTFNDKEIEYNI